MEKRYQVFVSSTFEDLKEERQYVTQALLRMNCIPSGMELFPASDDDQWTLIKRVIDECDYFLVVIGGRYGSTNQEGISFTEMEYDYAIQTKKPVVAFLHKNPESIPLAKSEQDTKKKKKLDAFRSKASKKMAAFWDLPSDLAYQVAHGVNELKKIRPEGGWVRADSKAFDGLHARIAQLEKQLSACHEGEPLRGKPWPKEAMEILKGAAGTELGRVICRENMGVLNIQAGDYEYKGDDGRSVAFHKDIVDKLASADFITEITEGLYSVSHEGYKFLAGLDDNPSEASDPKRLNLDLKFANVREKRELGREVVVRTKPVLVVESSILEERIESRASFTDSSLFNKNEQFYKELNVFVVARSMLYTVGFAVTNHSASAALDVRMTMTVPKTQGLFLTGENGFPKRPFKFNLPSISKMFPNPRVDSPFLPSGVDVEEFDERWELEVCFRKVQPRATVWSNGIFFIGSLKTLRFDVLASVYADNLPAPLTFPMTFDLDAFQPTQLTLEQLYEIEKLEFEDKK